MIITTDNRLRSDLTSIAMTGAVDGFPLANCYSNALVEKTLYTNTITITLGSSTGIDYFAFYSNDADTVTVTPSGEGAVVLSTSYDGWFYSALTAATSYTVTMTGTGDIYFNYIYIGDHIKLEYIERGTVPNRNRNDIQSESNTRQLYTTAGVSAKSQSVSVPDVTRANWLVFDDWQAEPSATDNQFFVQWEDDPTSYPPYFANIQNYNVTGRDKTLISFTFDVREAK